MKKFIVSLLLILCITVGYAETTKFRAFRLTVAEMSPTNEFIRWGTPQSVDILIVISESRLTIYSKETQIFDEAGVTDPFVATGRANDITLLLVDKEGKRCKAQFTLNEGIGQIYFKYADIQYVYSVKPIE